MQTNNSTLLIRGGVSWMHLSSGLQKSDQHAPLLILTTSRTQDLQVHSNTICMSWMGELQGGLGHTGLDPNVFGLGKRIGICCC